MSVLSRRLLDPIERTTEVLFGLIMVLTFTSSISVASGGEASVSTELVAAIGCNLAWGFVDAVMYLMAKFLSRARDVATLRALRETPDADLAHSLILDSLPPIVAGTLTQSDVESLRQRLSALPDPDRDILLARNDFAGALAVFLIVFLSTMPVVLPFVIMDDAARALRTSNAIAVALLFVTGWSLGRHAGRPGWRIGLGMVLIGSVLVATTMALGG